MCTNILAWKTIIARIILLYRVIHRVIIIINNISIIQDCPWKVQAYLFFQIGVNLFHCKLCQVDNFFVDNFIIPRYLNKLSIENVVSELLRCVMCIILYYSNSP